MNRNTRTALIAVIAITGSLACPTLAAQETDTARLQRLVAESRQLYENGDYQGSLDRLREARAIVDHPDIAYNIARSLQKLSRCRDAREAYEAYMNRDDVSEQDVAQARAQLAQMEACREEVDVAFACNVPATLSVDGGTEFSCGESRTLEEGTYFVQARAEGYETASNRFTVDASANVPVEIRLTPVAEDEVQPTATADWQRPVAYGAIGTGGALLVSGLVIDVRSAGRAKRMEEAAADGDEQRWQKLRDGAPGAKTATLVLYGSGVVLGAVGATLLVLSGNGDASQARVQVGPAGIGVAGEF